VPHEEQSTGKENSDVAGPYISINGQQSLVNPSTGGGIPRHITLGARGELNHLLYVFLSHVFMIIIIVVVFFFSSSSSSSSSSSYSFFFFFFFFFFFCGGVQAGELPLRFPTDRFKTIFFVEGSNEFYFVNMRIKGK
jgi:hypothetical protein